MSEWWTSLRPRERKFLAAGALALALFAIILTFSVSGRRAEGEVVELAQAPPPAAAPPPATMPPPPPAGFTAPPMTTPQPPAPATGALMLYGVSSGGPGGGAAILGPAGGIQRAVRVGRPVAGGMVLKEVGPQFAVLSGPGGDLRLELTTPAPVSTP